MREARDRLCVVNCCELGLSDFSWALCALCNGTIRSACALQNEGWACDSVKGQGEGVIIVAGLVQCSGTGLGHAFNNSGLKCLYQHSCFRLQARHRHVWRGETMKVCFI